MTNEEIRQFMSAELTHCNTDDIFDVLCNWTELKDCDEMVKFAIKIFKNFDVVIERGGIPSELTINRKDEIIINDL